MGRTDLHVTICGYTQDCNLTDPKPDPNLNPNRNSGHVNFRVPGCSRITVMLRGGNSSE